MAHFNLTWKLENHSHVREVKVLSKGWWYYNGDAVLDWLVSEGLLDTVHYPTGNKSPSIFLHTDEQVSYFKLRWKQ